MRLGRVASTLLGIEERLAVSTYLLHDTSLALGKCNVATGLVVDELDLNLATLAAALLVIVIVVVGGAGTLALDASVLSDAAVANLRLVEVGRRGLVVLIGDVGHCGQVRGCWMVSQGSKR